MYCPGCGSGLAARAGACPRCGLALPERLWVDLGLHGETEASAATPAHRVVGQVLDGRYRIDRFVARGGMGEVYAGVDTVLDRPIAVKFLADELSQESELVQRFLREAQAAAQLDHPNLVPVYAAGRLGTRPFFVMRHVRGHTLADWVASSGRLPIDAAIDIAVQLCDGLAHVHAHKCIHRDIKPQNIMVEPNGRCVILDFGILRRVNQTVTSSGIITGTPAYIAPEQARDPKSIDSRSDLYALGVTMFEMLTAQLPFRAESPFQLLVKHQTDPAPRPSSIVRELPPAIDAIVLKLLAKSPDERYSTAKDVREALVAARDRLKIVPAAPGQTRIAPPQPVHAAPSPLNTTTVPEPAGGLLRARSPEAARPDPNAVAVRERKKTATLMWAIALGVIAGTSATWPLWGTKDVERPRRDPQEVHAPADTQPMPSPRPRAEAPARGDAPEEGAPPPPVGARAPAGASAEATALKAGRGRLTVSTMPVSAALRIDGQGAARTPYSIELAAGQYRIELELAHHKAHVETARVEPGRTERVHVVLKPLPATLEIVTTGTAGTVSIDGVVVGQGERVSSELPPGVHDVRVRAGRQHAARRVELSAGEKRTVEFALEVQEEPPRRYTRRRR